ncbi:MAG: universal stress protein [Acidimicrobiales bacterium]|nr:universal stress protein [Acidimicrobiales bacterium]
MNRIHTIVVGTDGSATAAAAVDRAVELASAQGARLHIVTAYKPKLGWEEERNARELPEGMRWQASPGEVAERTARRAADTGAAVGVPVECHTAPGDPADVLVATARAVGADLLVVGNRGMRGTGRMVVPSVPNRVSHHAGCDVLIVDTTAA